MSSRNKSGSSRMTVWWCWWEW